MSTKRKLAIVIVWVFTLLLVGVIAVRSKLATKSLGDAPQIQFQNTSSPDAAIRNFLDGDFVVIRDVSSLPGPVLRAFTEVGGSRTAMANPGERFEAGDVIWDESIPRKRLIFAGVSGTRCFVHYEQGGRAHSFLVALFDLTPPGDVRAIWRGHCGPAVNIADLRSQIANGCPYH